MKNTLKESLDSINTDNGKNASLDKNSLVVFLEKYGHTKKTAEKEVEKFLS